MNPQDDQSNQPQPVAYDQHGRPLYAHPPAQPQTVHLARPHEPVQPALSAEARQRHEQSVRDYPMLNLSDGEYVILAIRRHPIGLLSIWATVAIMVGLVAVALPLIILGSGLFGGANLTGNLLMIVGGLSLLFVLGGYIAHIVYQGNRFFLTNESVIQHIQHSLFSKREQSISLGGIEDASFRQHGILQHFLNYGSLRLSTEGDETTYRFNYVGDPRQQVTALNDAVEAFKLGRPVKSYSKD